MADVLPADIRRHVALLALRGRQRDQFADVVTRMARSAPRPLAVMLNVDGRVYSVTDLGRQRNNSPLVDVCVRGTVKRRAVWKVFPGDCWCETTLGYNIDAIISRIPKRRKIKPALVVVVRGGTPINSWSSRYTRASRAQMYDDVLRGLVALKAARV